ncbi:MAG: DUF2125 domain-containing protein [Caulobacterales bacterium]
MSEQESPPEAQPAPYRAQRRWIILPFAVFGLLIVAYSAIWFKSKDQALKSLAQWVQSEKAQGKEAGYKNARVTGYPLRFALEIEGLNRADPARGSAWTASRLRINALPYDLRHVIVESLGPQTFQFSDGRGWVLNMKSGLASLHVDKHGLKRLSVQVQEANWTSSDGLAGKLKAFALQAAPEETDAAHIRFETEAVEGHVPEIKSELAAFGQDFKSIKAKGIVTQAQVFASGFSPGALDLWAAQGGAAQFESFNVSWGPAELKGAGQASFDRLRRPAGKVDFKVEDSAKLARALVDKGWLQGSAASNFINAARIADIAGIGLKVNLEAEDGTLSFWGVPLRELQPAYSPAVPDASASPVAGG